MEALGLIEVVGLAAGVEAADVACKSASVELVGYELAKGGGFVTIKVLGKVGAVTAAVEAAAEAAARITRVVSKLVIPRPNTQVEPMVRSAATVGLTPRAPEPKVTPPAPEPEPAPEPGPAPAPEPEAEAAPEAAPVKAAAPTKPAGTRTPARETAKAPAKATANPAKTNAGRK